MKKHLFGNKEKYFVRYYIDFQIWDISLFKDCWNIAKKSNISIRANDGNPCRRNSIDDYQYGILFYSYLCYEINLRPPIAS